MLFPIYPDLVQRNPLCFFKLIKFLLSIQTGNSYRCAILIAERVSPNHDRFCPSRHKTRYVFTNNWLTKYCPAKNVSNSSVRGFPHFFQVKLLYTVFVRRYGCAFNTDIILFNCSCTIDCNLSEKFFLIIQNYS